MRIEDKIRRDNAETGVFISASGHVLLPHLDGHDEDDDERGGAEQQRGGLQDECMRGELEISGVAERRKADAVAAQERAHGKERRGADGFK